MQVQTRTAAPAATAVLMALLLCSHLPSSLILLFSSAYPDLDCVSIGPTIHHAHSPDECLMIDTVAPFYEWLKQSIVNISKDSIKQ